MYKEKISCFEEEEKIWQIIKIAIADCSTFYFFILKAQLSDFWEPNMILMRKILLFSDHAFSGFAWSHDPTVWDPGSEHLSL